MVIVTIFRNLFYRTLGTLLGPLHWVWKPVFLVVFWVGGFYLLMALFVDKDTDVGSPDDHKNRVIEQITKREDGNSQFAKNLILGMDKVERYYYGKAFETTMSSVADGTAQKWEFYNVHGTLMPITTFKNKSGETCRTFKEVLKVKYIEQTSDGLACQHPSQQNWCKLKPNDAPTCKLQAESSWDRTKRKWKKSLDVF